MFLSISGWVPFLCWVVTGLAIALFALFRKVRAHIRTQRIEAQRRARSEAKGKTYKPSDPVEWGVSYKEARTIVVLVEMAQTIFWLVWFPIGSTALAEAPCLRGLAGTTVVFEMLLIARGVFVFFWRFVDC